MNKTVKYFLNRATNAEIVEHLLSCDSDFVPRLSDRVDIDDYAQKIASKATRFEAWLGNTLVGLVAAYCNDQETQIVYITSVSVLRVWADSGVATSLVGQCIEHAKLSGMRQISLQVDEKNKPAVKLYEKMRFVAGKVDSMFVTMNLHLESEGEHEQQA